MTAGAAALFNGIGPRVSLIKFDQSDLPGVYGAGFSSIPVTFSLELYLANFRTDFTGDGLKLAFDVMANITVVFNLAGWVASKVPEFLNKLDESVNGQELHFDLGVINGDIAMRFNPKADPTRDYVFKLSGKIDVPALDIFGALANKSIPSYAGDLEEHDPEGRAAVRHARRRRDRLRDGRPRRPLVRELRHRHRRARLLEAEAGEHPQADPRRHAEQRLRPRRARQAGDQVRDRRRRRRADGRDRGRRRPDRRHPGRGRERDRRHPARPGDRPDGHAHAVPRPAERALRPRGRRHRPPATERPGLEHLRRRLADAQPHPLNYAGRFGDCSVQIPRRPRPSAPATSGASPNRCGRCATPSCRPARWST